MADETRVYVDEDDSDIREADRDMRESSLAEQRSRSPRSIDYWAISPRERDERHQEMQRAAERGMALRRGRNRVRELGKALSDALNAPPKSATKKRGSASKRK